MSKKDSPRKISVGLVQMTCTLEPEPNLEKALVRIGEAAAQGAQIVCLQELFRSQYFCQTEDIERFKLAEPIPGPTSQAICQAAREHGVAVLASLFERRAPGLYHNTSITVDADGEIVGKYRKMHIPDDPLFYEKFYFTPGDLGFQAHQTQFGKIGSLVCWDQWYPEGARLTAMRGAQILFYPTAIGWLPGEEDAMNQAQHSAWETMQRSHAIANGCYVVSVNRVGVEGELQFWGGSFVADPYGTVIAKATHDKEEILVVECDLDFSETTRQYWPFFRDRRIDFYGDLTKRYLERD